MQKLPETFFQRPDTIKIANDLIGMHLVTEFNGIRTSGKIVETEAYLGAKDRACHAYGNLRTARTKEMFMPGGIAYVFLIYGRYSMFNIVTNIAEVPHAILIRAIEPVEGINQMQIRRNQMRVKRTLTAGPGVFAQALGIEKVHTGLSLQGQSIWLEDYGECLPASQILASPRVRVAYAGEDAYLPYRFREKNSRWTSLAK